MPRRRYAMQNVATRRKGAKKPDRRWLRKRSRSHIFSGRFGQWAEHYFLRDRDQRQRASSRRASARWRHRNHPLNPHACEEQNRAFYSSPARFADKDDPAPVGQSRTHSLTYFSLGTGILNMGLEA